MNRQNNSAGIKRSIRCVRREIAEYFSLLSSMDFEGLGQKISPRVNSNSIFVFGNQKSGTSVIAALLADYSASSLTLDIKTFKVQEQEHLHNGKLTIKEFVDRHKYEFSKQIIKEPALTFLYKELKTAFNLEKSVFITRDPRDNIRSILNRVNIPGDLTQLDNLENLPKSWQMIIDNRWMGIENGNYIGSLSERWNKAVDTYLENRDDFLLIRYEDFLKGKVQAIANLASSLQLEQVNDITNRVDIQYQPMGNQKVSWDEFFGKHNLEKLEYLCSSRMDKLGYRFNKHQIN